MTVSIVVLIIGAIFLIIGLIGGELKIGVKEGAATIPKINSSIRILFGIIGIVFIAFGIWRELSTSTSPPPVATQTMQIPPTVLPSETPYILVSPTLPSPPSLGEYKAAFILPIASNVWPTREHFYVIEFGCTTNIQKAFLGDVVNFDVKDLSLVTPPPFFLRKDSVYDAMIYGNKIDAVSKSSESFASVIVTKFTYDEAQRVLDECNAFISVDGLQKIRLYKAANPVLDVQEIDFTDFQFLTDLP
jgi:hypothetical protein